MLRRGEEPRHHAARRPRRGIATTAIDACDPLRLARGHLEVGGRRPDVLGGDEATAEALDGATMRAEELLAIEGLIRSDDDGLAAAEREPRCGVLVGHATRQAECVGEGLGGR